MGSFDAYAVSTLSGTYRALVGLAYLIKCVAYNIFFDKANSTRHQEGIKIAKANICRGLWEIIPIVGNIKVAVRDVSRMYQRWYGVIDFIEYPDMYKNDFIIVN